MKAHSRLFLLDVFFLNKEKVFSRLCDILHCLVPVQKPEIIMCILYGLLTHAIKKNFLPGMWSVPKGTVHFILYHQSQ